MPIGDWDLTPAPEHSPAVDFLTRSGEGPFVDTHIDIMYKPEMRGRQRVYLSVATIQYLAQIAGIESGGSLHDEHRDAELIARGKLEAVKEHLGERLDDLARTLNRIAGAARLSDVGVDDPEVL
jgi:hypothetical protein